jgi:Flp pilus assembly protein TadD
MSKRTKRERRLAREARSEAKTQAEPKTDAPEADGRPAHSERHAEAPAPPAPGSGPAANGPEPAAAAPGATPASADPAAASAAPPRAPADAAPAPAPKAPPASPPIDRTDRPRAVTRVPVVFEPDDDDRLSPVEFELVMMEDRPRKPVPPEKRTSRVKVDEDPGQDLEAAAERLARARELVRDGWIEDAMELYREIVSDHPQSLKARNNLGVLYDELGQHERALEQFEIARGLVPDNVEVLSNLGAALMGLSRYEDAERELRRAQKIDPESVEVRANLGILYHRRGLYAQAENELRWVCERDHQHGPAHFYRGEALNRLGKVDQALDVLERAMRLQPNNYKIYHTMGILYDKKRMPVEASQMYRKMRELRS